MNPYRVTLARGPRPLQTIESRGPVVSLWLVAFAGIVALWSLAAHCAGKAEAAEPVTPAPSCAWGRDTACCIQPPSLGVAWLTDLRRERREAAWRN